MNQTDKTTQPRTSTSFAVLKQIETAPLSVVYAQAGPAGGSALTLLHWWPYDIREAPQAFAEVLIDVGNY
jgi:hypothetical protein